MKSTNMLFDGAPLAIVITDARATVVDANCAAQALLGVSPVTGANLHLDALVCFDNFGSAKEAIEQLEQTGACSSIVQLNGHLETRPFYKLDAVRFTDDAGSVSFIWYLADVTSLAQDAHQLTQMEKKYSVLFENMAAAHALHQIVVDDNGAAVDYVFLEVNRSFESLTGLKRENILGRKVTEVIPGIEKDAADWIGTYGKVALTGQSANIRQYAEPLDRWYLVTAYCPRPGQFIAQFQDITEQMELERRLAQAEKMESIGQLAGGIAHDFNNQLAGILGYAELLKSELASQPVLESYAHRILTAAERSADLTSQLLAFGRVGKIISIHVNLHDIIDEVIALLSRSLDKGIRIEKRLNASAATVLGDPARLQSAILNLALNARDAMANRGVLTFASSIATLGEDECVRNGFCISPGTYLRLAVCDTGTGMSESLQSRIFEPFFTTKEQGKGTGLGLAAVDGTIKDHGGAIRVNSRLGEGTEFCLFLPLDVEGQKALQQTAPAHHHKAKILVVDDEALIRDVAGSILRSLGYEVVCVKDGQEAVDYYRDWYGEVDVVLLDLVMPRLSGRDAFFLLREINSDVRVILSSGFSLNHDAQDLLNHGAAAFLQKPYRKASMASAVTKMLATQT